MADITETAVSGIYFALLRNFLAGLSDCAIGLIETDRLAPVDEAGIVGVICGGAVDGAP
jgi:hypothetical protein